MLSTQHVLQKSSACPKLGKSLVHQRATVSQVGPPVAAYAGYLRGRAGLYLALRAVTVPTASTGRELPPSLCSKMKFQRKQLPS